MSKGPENTFLGAVHRHLPEDLYRIKNNNIFNAGQPDVWYSGRASDLWVEYKFIVVPVKDATEIDLISVPKSGKGDAAISTLQQEWLLQRHDEGRRVGVIVGSKDGGVWFPGMGWDRVYTAGQFRSWMLSRKELAGVIADICCG